MVNNKSNNSSANFQNARSSPPTASPSLSNNNNSFGTPRSTTSNNSNNFKQKIDNLSAQINREHGELTKLYDQLYEEIEPFGYVVEEGKIIKQEFTEEYLKQFQSQSNTRRA